MMKSGLWWLPVMLFISCSIKEKKTTPASVAETAYAASFEQIRQGKVLLKEGDLVVRSGEEFSSQLIKQFNRHNQTYSHSGIVFYDHGVPMVYHIVNGDENPDEKLRMDSLERFCNPRKNSGYAIYRYNLNPDEVKELKKNIQKWYDQGVRFDSSFNYLSDDRMYCSEMIKKGLEIVTDGRIKITSTRPTRIEADFFAPHLKIPASKLEQLDIISIDNLFINPDCQLVRRFDFNPIP